jgi:glycerol uptake facilitator protein
MRVGLLSWYVASQLLGAIAAGGVVLLLFGDSIFAYETAHQITRGAPASVGTAMMFGEYFPNPGVGDVCPVVTMGTAAMAEGIGTFLLVLLVFVLTDGCNVGRPADGSTPVFIGAAVAAIISILAPLTQAGLNPARDFGPRLVAFLAGWNSVAIPGPRGGFFTVYILAPLLGGAAAAVCFRFLVSRFMGRPAKAACCQDGSCDAPDSGRRTTTEQQGES